MSGYARISIHALLAESDAETAHQAANGLAFLSTLSLRRATTRRASRQQPAGISIHALLAESDQVTQIYQAKISISIHALLAESDLTVLGTDGQVSISIHALLAESDYTVTLLRLCGTISIHALLAESDNRRPIFFEQAGEFLSTLSLRRATAKVHKTVGHFCAYETNFMGIASSC